MGNLSVLILSRSMAGKELLGTVRKRIGNLNVDCHTLTFNEDATDNIIFPHIAGRIRNINKGRGVVILVDSACSHAQLLQRLADECPAIVVSGFNDAMLAAIPECEDMSLSAAAAHLQSAAQNAIGIFAAND
ncbi:MAG: hypothetical protein HWE13_03170 [Gammaproteobacteria bacterium]|nr:hypothetical protein [Gammaproteobacteria bacterium]NVK87098.1 hypothetical protein [Gammaproteobacteria bacterium]